MIDPITVASVATQAGSVALSVGKGVISTAGKIIEISLPIVKQAGKISLKFIEGGVNAVREDGAKKIELSQKLSLFDNNLNLQSTFDEKQISSFNEKINYNLEIIKGQNEMLFLSNSIKYFVDSHKNRTGIDRSIAYALQNDVDAVLEYIKDEKVRFPGYLLHQCVSLSNTIEEYNIFYSSILNDGYVEEFTQEKADIYYSKTVGSRQTEITTQKYIPRRLQLDFYRRRDAENKKEEKSSLSKFIPFSSEDNKKSEQITMILERLVRELESNEELEISISEKLERSPLQKIVVENAS